MLIRRMPRILLVLAVALAVAVVGLADGGARPAQAGESRSLPERQLLFYNHAYGVLDRETADAIEHSDYLREFGNFEVRTTTGEQGTWTGRYLYGRETYVEFFGPGDLPDTTVSSAGMGVSVERDGDLATVIERLPEQGVPNPLEFHQTRDFGDGIPVPWFDAVFTNEQYDTFGAWGMEYRPEYFADPRSKTEPPNYPGDVGRERYLSDDYRDHLMRDVTGIRLGITELDLASTVPLLRAGGFVVRPVPGGGVVAIRGGTTIRLDAVPVDQVGVQRVDMLLNRPVGYRHEERIGQSTLVVGPGIGARWTFG
jgi:Family of unknown function (DUF5829)